MSVPSFPHPASRPPSSAAPARPVERVPALRIRSDELFANAVEVQIEHHGSVYRLKQTSLGKLILTK